MTQDNMMTPDENIPWLVNKAYTRLLEAGVDERIEWMKRLRLLTETQLARTPNIKRVQQLEKERATCLRTVTQLQEQVHALQRINRRYGKRILDTDKVINDILSSIDSMTKNDSATRVLAEVFYTLDKLLTNFPKELVKK